MIRYSIVIPVYNEEETLRSRFHAFISWLEGHVSRNPASRAEIEVIFAEDGSTDRSLPLLEKIKEKMPVATRIVHSDKRLGKGGGFRRGFLEARGRFVVQYDCDMAVPPSELPKLFATIEEGYDFAFGSRQHPRTRILNYPSFIRYVYGQVLYLFARFFFEYPFLETQCGFKIFDRKKFLPLVKTMKITGWVFELDLLLRANYHGLTFKEIPVIYKYIKESKINTVLDPIKIIIDILILRCKVLGYYPLGFPWKKNTSSR